MANQEKNRELKLSVGTHALVDMREGYKPIEVFVEYRFCKSMFFMTD